MTDQPNPGSASSEPGASSSTPPPPPPPPLAPLVDQQAPDASPTEGYPLAQGAPPAGWVAPGQEMAAPGAPAAPAAPTRGSKLRAWLILGGIVAFLAVVLFATMNNIGADDLAVGHCFDEPDETEVSTVTKIQCTEAHDAEVFFVGTYTGDESTYPGDTGFDQYVTDNCKPAFAAYVGEEYDTSTTYDMGFFYPLPDGWEERNDRSITCYVVRTDGSKLSESVKVGA